MKCRSFFQSLLVSPMLAVGLIFSLQTAGLAHAGHGDEFQAQGKAQRVQVNSETDSMLGIRVTPITTAAGDGQGVMVPTTALVEADGKQLAFVQFENFYEPVEVVTGATSGDQIAVIEGLSVGEQLVTQGGLSLYSESLKAKADSVGTAAPTESADSTQAANDAHAQAHAEGKPHSHDTASEFPMTKYLVVAGGVVVALGGTLAAMNFRKKA